MTIDHEAARRAIRAFLVALGHDPGRSAILSETPARVTQAFAEDLLSGYAEDIDAILEQGSEPSRSSGPVVLRNIAVTTVCPHHLMPATGTATLAYAPGQRVFGLGALAKLVHARARRLTLQEDIVAEVTRDLVEHGARGAYLELSLRHSCLSARGSRELHTEVSAIARAGHFDSAEGVAELSLLLGRLP